MGHRYTVFIYPCSLNLKHPQEPGWHWFFAPLPEASPITKSRSTYGVEIDTASSRRGLSLGYADQVETYGPEPGESQLTQIYFNREQPEDTYVLMKETLNDPQLNTCN